MGGVEMAGKMGIGRIILKYIPGIVLGYMASVAGDIKSIAAICRGILSAFPIIIATLIVLSLCYVGFRAAEDEKVLELVIKLQTLGAGVAALAASLIAYHGAGANAREARRKDAVERAERDRSLLVRTRHSSFNLISMMARLRQQIYAEMKGPPGKRHLNVTFPQDEAICEAWAHIGVLPQEVEKPLSIIMSRLQQARNLVEVSAQTHDDQDGERLECLASAILEEITLVERAAKDIVAITSARMIGVPISAYRVVDALRAELIHD